MRELDKARGAAAVDRLRGARIFETVDEQTVHLRLDQVRPPPSVESSGPSFSIELTVSCVNRLKYSEIF